MQAAQEVCVLANRFVYCLAVLLRQVYLLHVVLVPQEVLILEGRRALETTLDISAVMASLQVIDARDLVLVVEAQCVSHQDQMHFLIVLHLDSVHAVDTGEK